MHRLKSIVTVTLDPLLLILLAAAVILLPLRWVTAWIVAVFIHELCHYFALKLFGIRVYSIRLSSSGAVIESEQPSPGREMICALAGPIGGLTVLVLAKWLPRLALCGLVQSLFNLLPIYPMDGGRAVRCLIDLLVPKRYQNVIEVLLVCLARCAIALCGIYGVLVLHLGMLPLLVVAILIGKSVKIPCKQGTQRVQ